MSLKKPSLKSVFLTVIIVVTTLFVADFLAQMMYRRNTIAVANGVRISQAAFEDRMREECGPGVIDTMIKEEIIRQEVEKANITVSNEEIDQEIEEEIKRYGDTTAYWQDLQAKGITRDQLEHMIEVSLAVDKLLLPTIPEPTEEEIKEYYDQNKSLPQYTQPGMTYDDAVTEIRETLLITALEREKAKWLSELSQSHTVKNYLNSKPAYQPFGFLQQWILGDD